MAHKDDCIRAAMKAGANGDEKDAIRKEAFSMLQRRAFDMASGMRTTGAANAFFPPIYPSPSDGLMDKSNAQWQ